MACWVGPAIALAVLFTATGCSKDDIPRFAMPTPDHRRGPAHAVAVAGQLDRGPVRRVPGVGPDHLVHRRLPAARRRHAAAARVQPADRDPVHDRAGHLRRRPVLLHRARRNGDRPAVAEPRRHGRGGRLPVGLAVQLPEQCRRQDGDHLGRDHRRQRARCRRPCSSCRPASRCGSSSSRPT